jgi:large subunit ribosomal protein L23
MSIYVKPIITEKFSAMADKSRYAFVVERTANKVEIKKAIEKAYGVTVSSVNTMNYIGKVKFRYTRTKIMTGLVKKAKKAVVTLKKGDTIDFYGNI